MPNRNVARIGPAMSTVIGTRSVPQTNAPMSTTAVTAPAPSRRMASSMLAWRQVRP